MVSLPDKNKYGIEYYIYLKSGSLYANEEGLGRPTCHSVKGLVIVPSWWWALIG